MGWLRTLLGLPVRVVEEPVVEVVDPRFILVASLPDADGEVVLNDGKSMSWNEAVELREHIENAAVSTYWLKGRRNYYPYGDAQDHLSIRAVSINQLWIERRTQ